jgi:hypothetical protein
LPRAGHWAPRDTWSADEVLAALRAWAVEHRRAPRAYKAYRIVVVQGLVHE